MINPLPLEAEETLRQEDHLRSARAKMDEIRQENKRLKLMVSQMIKDYRSLKMHFHGIVQEDRPQRSPDSAPTAAALDGGDESELVSLTLGRFSAKNDQNKNSNSSKHQKNKEQLLDGLELGLDRKVPTKVISKNPSLEYYSSDGSKEERNYARHRSGDDEILERRSLKKPRVSVRALCDSQTMNDGCRWRKYGQKIAKGNPWPRAYYRCASSSSCPVRKHVQRCAENMSILTTTYEGTHNHPLPPSAASMASATSAAAAMLKCGSSTAPPGRGVSATSSTSPNRPWFNLSSSSSLAASCSPLVSISTSQSQPTVILDLTAPNHTSSPLNKSSSSLFSSLSSSSTSLNFAACDKIQDYQQEIMSDKIAAATKAITRNPKFQSALAAAVASIVDKGGCISNLDQERNPEKNVKWGENISFSQPSVNGTTDCAASYLNIFPQSLS